MKGVGVWRVQGQMCIRAAFVQNFLIDDKNR